jgi:predicted small secreted protein
MEETQMKKHQTIILVLLLLAFSLTACEGEEAAGQDPETIMTAAVGTMVASFFETQTAAYTPPVPTGTPPPTLAQPSSPTPVLSTMTLGPTPTPTPYFTPTPGTVTGTVTPTGTLATVTVDPSSLAFGCNNLAFVRDVSIPSGTVMEPGKFFTKTWKVENTGSCAWEYNYILTFTSGNSLDGETSRIQKKVASGGWMELSVAMAAPEEPGTYTSSWRFSDGKNLFGSTLSVNIVVKSPTATPVPVTVTPTFTPAPTSTPPPTPTPTPTSTTAPPTDTPTPTPTPP